MSFNSVGNSLLNTQNIDNEKIANFVERINEEVDAITKGMNEEDPKVISAAMTALESIVEPERTHTVDAKFDNRIDNIKDLYEFAEDWVELEDEEFFKMLVLKRVAAKIQELESIKGCLENRGGSNLNLSRNRESDSESGRRSTQSVISDASRYSDGSIPTFQEIMSQVMQPVPVVNSSTDGNQLPQNVNVNSVPSLHFSVSDAEDSLKSVELIPASDDDVQVEEDSAVESRASTPKQNVFIPLQDNQTNSSIQQPASRPRTPEQLPVSRPRTPEQQPVSRPRTPEQQPVSRPRTPEQQPVLRPRTPEQQPEQQPVSRPGTAGQRLTLRLRTSGQGATEQSAQQQTARLRVRVQRPSQSEQQSTPAQLSQVAQPVQVIAQPLPTIQPKSTATENNTQPARNTGRNILKAFGNRFDGSGVMQAAIRAANRGK